MKRTDQQSKKTVRQDPAIQKRGPFSRKSLALISQPKTDEERDARELAARKKVFLRTGLKLPTEIPLTRIRKEIAARNLFQRKLEAERKTDAAAGVEVTDRERDFIEQIKNHIESKHHRRPRTTGELVSSLCYFDWRLAGIVNQSRNQEGCGSCWAHVAAEAFESRLMYNVNRVNNTDVFTRIALSVQGVLDCVRRGDCIKPGSHTHAFDYFVRNGARLFELNEEGTPIEFGTGPTGKAGPCLEDGGKGIRAFRWNVAIPLYPLLAPRGKASIRFMKRALVDHGALAVKVTAAAPFHDYKEKQYPSDVYDKNFPRPTNHFVLLTGWDDKRDAWIIVNSRGRKWGSSCVDLAKVKKYFPWTLTYAKNVLKSDKGCMYIKRGFSGVGELAAWIEPHGDHEELLKNARIEMAHRKAEKEDWKKMAY